MTTIPFWRVSLLDNERTPVEPPLIFSSEEHVARDALIVAHDLIESQETAPSVTSVEVEFLTSDRAELIERWEQANGRWVQVEPQRKPPA